MNKYSKKEPKKNRFNLATINYAEMLVLRMINVFKASKVKDDHGHVSLYMGVKIVKVYLTHTIFPKSAKERKQQIERVSFTGLVKGGRGGQKKTKKKLR